VSQVSGRANLIRRQLAQAASLKGATMSSDMALSAVPAHELSRAQNMAFHSLVKLRSASPSIEIENGV
jgi:hypothetical protein